MKKNTLEIFTSEAGAYDAVLKISKEYLVKQRDLFVKNTNLFTDNSPQEVGEKLKALDQGILLINGIFREIAQFRKQVDRQSKNPAR